MRELSNLGHLDEGHDVVRTRDRVHGKDRGHLAKGSGNAFEATGKSLNEHIGSKAPPRVVRGERRIALGFGFSFHIESFYDV
jgi:hypothetical protein